MVLRENSPGPVFSDLPAGHGRRPAEGARACGWSPRRSGRSPRRSTAGGGGLGAAAIGLLDEAEGPGVQEPPQHDRHRGAGHPPSTPGSRARRSAKSILPASKGGGRMLERVGRRQAARRHQHQDRPRLPQRRRLAQEGRPDDPARDARTSRSSASTTPARSSLDATIVMDIGTARELLGLGPTTPSRPINVEPVERRRDRRRGRADRAGRARGPGAADLAVQPDGRRGHGAARPVPARWRSAWRCSSAGWASPTRC